MKKTKKPEIPLKFKITNLRTVAFPGPLVESDYLGLKIGDYLAKGSENTVYEVTGLSRDSLINYEQIYRELHRYGNVRDQKLLDLINSYQKNGNFGVCSISIIPVIRGGKQVAKGRSLRFSEIEHSPVMNYRGYKKVDLHQIMKNRDSRINTLEVAIMRLETKKNIQVKSKTAILTFLQTKNLTTKIEIRDSQGKVVDSVTPKELV